MSATATWVSPSTRPELIDELVSGVDRYNPANGGILEDYLYHQIRSQEYDCLANLAILKLYQFNPDLYNGDVVINILIKALTAAPMPDFNLCLALLGERRPYPESDDDEPDPLPSLLPYLTALSELLHQCRFPEFWKLYKSEPLAPLRENYTIECLGFDDSVREVVVRAVRAAFTKIGKQRLSNYLDLDGEDFVSFVEDVDWSLEDDVITIPPNPDNRIEATVVHENIQFPRA
ncbi:ARM repeat-containing protein [Sistotremastrum niveocremeum HHB9708]|uniref:Eukaryotic translation initiation factor 3 subunit K n=2 Tax=Sistotremastraceae TaxID=3402574 RepID=A0A164UD68_9AGAM|nr:ARM repeat-containing protein [Sistotremastrum niveocremeum HHB9708]KZT40056.1 ARM repeat-containing protein [Sistotremastrum suecicum HHB10207 ss-3]